MRIFISSLVTLLLVAGSQLTKGQSAEKKFTETVSPLYEEENKPFYHGVASGDPLTDRVIIWTLVTPDDAVSSIDVRREVATNENFDPVLKKESVTTSPLQDYTVKIDVTGLESNSRYYYRFHALDETFPAGRTKTLPAGSVDSLRFAVVSCSNWQHGYFNAYGRIASGDVDAEGAGISENKSPPEIRQPAGSWIPSVNAVWRKSKSGMLFCGDSPATRYNGITCQNPSGKPQFKYPAVIAKTVDRRTNNPAFLSGSGKSGHDETIGLVCNGSGG